MTYRLNDYVIVPTRGTSPDDNAMLGHGASVWKAGYKDGEPVAVVPNIYSTPGEACAQAGFLAAEHKYRANIAMVGEPVARDYLMLKYDRGQRFYLSGANMRDAMDTMNAVGFNIPANRYLREPHDVQGIGRDSAFVVFTPEYFMHPHSQDILRVCRERGLTTMQLNVIQGIWRIRVFT